MYNFCLKIKQENIVTINECLHVRPDNEGKYVTRSAYMVGER